ncbi:MAG: adenylate kinase family protein, partial [Armatimonadaceae bacterium]
EGAMVSDHLANRLVEEALGACAGGFCLDGYPRTVGQVESLDRLGATLGWGLDAAVYLALDSAEVKNRLSQRGREDDDREAVDKRLSLFEAQTLPVVDIYRKRGLLRRIDASGGTGDVFRAVCESLGVHV